MVTEDRVAVVTGAARGIGRGIAERLARDGLAVELWDIDLGGAADVAASMVTGGSRAQARMVDISDSTQVRSAGAELMAQWGRIDVLVNNAGWDRYSFFLDTDEAMWDRVIAINYRGTLNTCRYLGPMLTDAPNGRIVNIASDTAKLGYALEAVYSGTKGGIIAFSRALAKEIASTGTTVNVICPGATDTPLLREAEELLEGDPRFSKFFPKGFIPTVLEQMPLGRLGLPADVANGVAFLIRQESNFITGQILSIDGGQTMYYGM